jgi:hypothetical protein
MRSLDLIFNKILIDGHEKLMFLTLVWGGMRGRSGWVRTQRETRFVVSRKNNLLIFLHTLSSFQPSMGEIHEDLGLDFIPKAINKPFLEKSIRHALCYES